MPRNLVTSQIERQNVLNNKYAIERVQNHLGLETIHFEGKVYLTKQMVAEFYQVDERTIERYIEQHNAELSHNGYILCKGKMLKELKLQFAPVINVGTKTTQIALFDFRSFLNIGMLLAESENARRLRSLLLDIVIATISEKSGGGSKYINLRDIDYLPTANS